MLSSDRVASFLRRRILQAREARKAIGLPSAHKTNAYRLINSEGDSLSGLVVDRFGTDLVVQSSSAWVESHKDVVLAALAESAGHDPEEEDAAAETIAWRSDAGILKKEGVEVESGSSSTRSSAMATGPRRRWPQRRRRGAGLGTGGCAGAARRVW